MSPEVTAIVVLGVARVFTVARAVFDASPWNVPKNKSPGGYPVAVTVNVIVPDPACGATYWKRPE